MDFSFLGEEIANALKKVDFDKLTEIRIRRNFPVICKYSFERHYLTNNGVDKSNKKTIIIDDKRIDSIINLLTEHSIYAHNEKIKQGFLISKDGIRVGVVGDCVYDGGKLISIKNFSSLYIRIPHDIKDCSESFFSEIFQKNNIKNTLIISPPAFGKTTLLKDIALKLDNTNLFSILILDERGEFSSVSGENIDILRYTSKYHGFLVGLRSMSPNVIITDEICGENDWKYLDSAKNSGVKIIASIHSDGFESVKNKKEFIDNIFDCYVVLDGGKTPGVVKDIIKV